MVLSIVPSVQTPVAKRCDGPKVCSATKAVASFSVDAGLNCSFSAWLDTTLPSSVSTSTPCNPYSGRAASAASAGDGDGDGNSGGDGDGVCPTAVAQSANKITPGRPILIRQFAIRRFGKLQIIFGDRCKESKL